MNLNNTNFKAVLHVLLMAIILSVTLSACSGGGDGGGGDEDPQPQNNPPIANAGQDQLAPVGQMVTLTGSLSSDPENSSLTYAWSITAQPTGSSVSIIDATQEQSRFSPTHEGIYTIQLIVNDGEADSSSDQVIITATTAAPGALLKVTITSPRSLLTVGHSPVIVQGTVSPSDAVLTLNGVAINHQDGEFSANVAVEEGLNTIVARAVRGNEQITDSISAALDLTPPHITIESHTDGQTVYQDKVTVTGLVNDIVRGTVEATQASVTVNARTATISNRSYSGTDIQLTPGNNEIIVNASDAVGNVDSKTINLNYVVPTKNRIEIVSGDNQSSTINEVLAAPVIVKVTDPNQNPVAGESVVFRVTQGSGLTIGSGNTEERGTVVQTGADGIASVGFRVGARVGASNQKVSAKIVGYETEVVFNASTTGLPGDKISVNAGNNQRGAVGQRLASPLVAIVSDVGGNVVSNARVQFDVVAGDGAFLVGGITTVLVTDSDGRAYAEYVLGNTLGLDAQRINATLLDSNSTDPLIAGFTATAFIPGASGDTVVSGVVLDNQDNPLANVTVRIEGTTRQAVTDANGVFNVTEAPVGPVHLIVDGSTIPGSAEYPTLSFNVVTVAGVDNPMPQPVYMVQLTADNMAYAGLEDVEIAMKEFPGFKLEIAKDSVTFPGGEREGYVSVTAVNANKVPMTPPNGSQPQFVITVQPSGALFDPPARITIPNVDGLKPGQQTEMYSFDHDLEEFVTIGVGTVSEDGSVVVSNPGVGIIKAGWFAAQPPGGSGGVAGGNSGGPGNGSGEPGDGEPGFWESIWDTIDDVIDDLTSCVTGGPCSPIDSAQDFINDVVDGAGEVIDDFSDAVADAVDAGIDTATGLAEGLTELAQEAFDKAGEVVDMLYDKAHEAADPIVMATGELHYAQTDLVIPGRGFDFELKRTYRSRLHFNGRLGYNWVFNYHQLLLIPEANTTNQNIVRSMEDGRQYTYTTNGDGSYASPDNLFDVLTENGDGSYTIRQASGFKTNFDTEGQMVSKVDRFGNKMEFVYDDQDRLSKVIDTLGREIVFSYRTDSGHIDTVTDFSGRSVRYFYDANRDLIAARTPIISGTPNGNDFTGGKFTYYTYSSGFDEQADPRLKRANHNLLTVTDPQGNVYLENTYNNDPDSYEFDKITTQQFGSATEDFQLSYTQLNAEISEITPNLAVNRTVMIDRNGNRHEYEHNVGGMLLEERTYTNRNVVSDDPEFFTTNYIYNQDGLKLSMTNPEGDKIEYQYDTSNALRYMQSNLLSSTYSPGSRGADQAQLVETFNYEPVYNQLRSATNRRGYLVSNTFDYQHADNRVALATELNITEADVDALITAAGMSLEGGVSGQIGGNVVRVDMPTATLPDATTQAIFKERLYNRFGQLLEEIDAEGLVTRFEYYGEEDPDGDGNATVSNRTLASDSGGYRKAVIRDARIDDRRTRLGSVLAIRSETLYDSVGNKIAVTDGRSNTTRFIRNQLNQVVRKISSAPFEYLTDYYYDANNNLVRTSQQNVSTTGSNLSGFVHTIYRYNLLNDKTAEIKIPASGVYLETTYEYDANQNIVAIQQPEGNRVERIYDERDLVVSVTQGAGSAEASTRTLRYDGNRNLISETDAVDNDGDGNPETTAFTYDGYNRLIQSIDAVGNRLVYSYDANNNRINEQRFGASGIVGIDNEILLAETAVTFDEADRPYQRDDSLLVNGFPQNVGAGLTPDDNKVTGINWFDANGLVMRSVDDNGKTSTSVYDGLNRRILVTDANGNTTSTSYDANSNLTQVAVTQKSAEGRVADKVITSTITYDELNRKLTETNALGNVTAYRYDSRNNVIQTTDALGNISLFIYDGINRLLEERKYLAEDGVGTGGLDRTNPTNRDGMISTFYAYDANSRLISQADDNGNATNYSYDALNRRITNTYADATTVSFGYDKDHNLQTRTDQNGSVFSYQYDGINRLLESTVVGATDVIGSNRWTYSYDGLSRRMKATDNNDPALTSDDATVEYRYNSLNYLLSESNNGLKAQATYDGLGNRQTLQYANGRQLSYSFDNIYNLKGITEGTDSIVEYDYAGSRVLERRSGNGTKLSYINAGADSGYDGINRVLQHRHTDSSDQLVAGFEYAYDKANNRRFEVDQFAQLADVYEYDSAYRLIRAAYRVPAANDDLQAIVNNETVNSDVATITSPKDASYLLDGVGNWSSLQTVEENISNAVGYQTNEMNEYARIGAAEQSHDDNGNLLNDGERNYHYDAKNRLVRVTTLGGNTVANYKYDAFDRRIEKKAGSETVRYVHFGKRVLEERNIFNQLQRQYVYGRGVDEVLQLRSASNDDFYYHDNSLGSVVALTDANGAVVERYRYDAYGVTTVLAADGVTVRAASAVGNSYGFTGRRMDAETGFYYYRARYYAPERGRFIQRDPLGYADGMGVYAYVGNNPGNFVDPDGTCAKEMWADAKDWTGDKIGFTQDIVRDAEKNKNWNAIKGSSSFFNVAGTFLSNAIHDAPDRLKSFMNGDHVGFDLFDNANLRKQRDSLKKAKKIGDGIGKLLGPLGKVMDAENIVKWSNSNSWDTGNERLGNGVDVLTMAAPIISKANPVIAVGSTSLSIGKSIGQETHLGKWIGYALVGLPTVAFTDLTMKDLNEGYSDTKVSYYGLNQ